MILEIAFHMTDFLVKVKGTFCCEKKKGIREARGMTGDMSKRRGK